MTKQNLGSYYDQWNPKLCEPRLGACRECNGIGYDPYHQDCEACHATGFRAAWRWRYHLMVAKSRLATWWYKENFIRCRCVLCGKLERILFIRLPHDDEKCVEENLPF